MTLLTEVPDLPDVARAQLRQIVSCIVGFPGKRQQGADELIQYRWTQIGGPELLPILRRVVNSPPRPGQNTETLNVDLPCATFMNWTPRRAVISFCTRSSTLKAILGISILGRLPDKELPQIEEPILAKFSIHNGTFVDTV